MNISSIVNIIQEKTGKKIMKNNNKNMMNIEIKEEIVETANVVEVAQVADIKKIIDNPQDQSQDKPQDTESVSIIADNTSDGAVSSITASKDDNNGITNSIVNNSLSIEAILQLEEIINSYKMLDEKIHLNKNKIADLQKNTIRMKKNKQRIEGRINKNEAESASSTTDTTREKNTTDVADRMGNNNLTKEITDNKYHIKNKTCHSIKNHVDKIQSHIKSDTKKSASYIEPLYLSCKLLKTQILYTQALENTVGAFDMQKELELQQDDANKLITNLVTHFKAIKNHESLADVDGEALN